jgi:hydroxymethylbilane synthase
MPDRRGRLSLQASTPYSPRRLRSKQKRNGDMTATWLRIGTRGSPLALAQAHETRRRLAQVHGVDEEAIAIVVIKTTGDMIQDRALSEAGGKGLFTKELDAAQIRGDIDIAVHSGKDLPTFLPAELEVAGFLPREDVRDAWISVKYPTPADLPPGAIVGTASLRRGAMLKRLRPDVAVALLRGNVGTRLDKVKAGEFDATLLALAGLRRLGLADRATSVLDTREFLPAVAQGAIGITARVGDAATTAKLAPILHADTTIAVTAERAFLRVLDGSCRTPIGGYATVAGGTLTFRGMVLKPDGSQVFECDAGGSTDQAAAIGAAAGHDLLRRMPADLFTTT